MKMKNPCDDCLVKVNCTAVCFGKENYKTLILNAITQSRSVMGSTQKYFQTYSDYLKMLSDTNEQQANIVNRAAVLKNPN